MVVRDRDHARHGSHALMPYYPQPFTFGTPTTRAVALATAYQPSLEFTTLVYAPGTVTHAASQDGELRMQISPDNVTYTTVSSMGGAGIRDTLSTAATDRGTLQAEVPPGWYYKIISQNNAGAPTYALGTAVEQTR